MFFCMTLFILVLLSLSSDVMGYHGRFCDGNKILDTMQHVIKCNGHGRNCSGDKFIGFDAVLGSHIKNGKAGQRIVFDRISLNAGDAYKDGVFTCPVPGIYYFSWKTLAFPGKIGDTVFMLNKTKKRANYARNNTQYSSAATTILQHLKKGDRVWIQIRYNGGYVHDNHSSFTGVLLKSD